MLSSFFHASKIGFKKSRDDKAGRPIHLGLSCSSLLENGTRRCESFRWSNSKSHPAPLGGGLTSWRVGRSNKFLRQIQHH